MAKIDGVIICTAHACHAEMGLQFLAAGKHVLMEKPMTVDVAEARLLAAAADKALRDQKVAFMVNNTANYRAKCLEARRLVEAGELGTLHHVLAVMYSPLMFLFDDPANDGGSRRLDRCFSPTARATALGTANSAICSDGCCVGALDVEEVTAMTHRSERSGADLMDAALVRLQGWCGTNREWRLQLAR